MTRKDYEAIARAVRYAKPLNPSQSLLSGIANSVLETVAINIAEVMEMDNPRFDRDRFLTACGVRS